jgi:hypothetical protein
MTCLPQTAPSTPSIRPREPSPLAAAGDLMAGAGSQPGTAGAGSASYLRLTAGGGELDVSYYYVRLTARAGIGCGP